jgi:23S rRNA A2030 N6-methylase RlmJ
METEKAGVDYNHLSNAGNVFDSFKHGLLMKAVEVDYPSVYFESHCGFASYDKPELWESSWIKVQRLTNCSCLLCDINPEVGKSIPDSEYFNFKCTDGFEEAKKRAYFDLDPPSLFFIDPPYKDNEDWLKVIKLTETFSKRNWSKWIVWYPIFKNGLTFRSEVPAVEMYWTTTKNLHACGMAFGGFDNTDMEEIHNCLGLLQWSLSASRVEKINGT